MGIKANITTNKIEVAAVGRQGIQGPIGPSGGGGLIDQLQMIYVSKVGNDANSGLNIGLAKLTITAAITAAALMTPSESNQVTIQVIDAGDYQENPVLPEWVHIFGPNAGIDGLLEVSNNCVVDVRRLQNSVSSTQCVKKADSGGLSKVSTTLMIVTTNQEGVRCFAGQIGLTVGTMTIDSAEGLVAQNGSRILFNIQYVSMTNGSDFLKTNLAGVTSNSFFGEVLRIEDDNTSRFLVANAVGDMIDVQAGSVEVLELYELGTDTVLNLYANTTAGTRIDGTNSQANIMDLSGTSNLQGDINVEGALSGPTIEAKLENGDNVSELVNDAGYLTSVPVDSVNTQTGAVVLDADDVSDSATTNKYTTAAEITKLSGIEALAQVNTIDSGDNISLLTNDVPYLSQATTGTIYISSLADIAQFLNVGVYELPAGRYEFTASVDFVTATISLEDINGCYNFVGSCLPLISYSGTASFITSPTTGIILQLCGLFITTPSATCAELSNGNSVIMNIAVLFNCQLGLDIDTFDFITLIAAPIIGCDDGIQATNVKTITARLPQYNGGANVGGSYLTAMGALSERLIMSTIDAQPESTESFLNIDATYGGDVSLGLGVLKTGGGTFFDAAGRNQVDVDINVASVKNVADSGNVFSGHFTGNTTDTVIVSAGTAVKINAVWNTVGAVRFTFDATGTATYIGKEFISISASIIATTEPAAGGEKLAAAYLALNGVIIPTSKGVAAVKSGAQIGAVALIALNTGDTVEAWIANEDDGIDLLITTATFNGGASN